MTATGEVDVVNKTFLDYSGKPPRIDSWQVVVHPEDLQGVQELARSLEAQSRAALKFGYAGQTACTAGFTRAGGHFRTAAGAIARWYVC